jgi:Tol biopolymer transport system component
MDSDCGFSRGLAWASVGSHSHAFTVCVLPGYPGIYVDGWDAIVYVPASREGAGSWQAAWDPTRPRFVFASSRSGQSDLYLWDGEQDGAEVQLTSDEESFERNAQFDPSGSRVVYERGRRGWSHIMVLDMTTSVSTTIVNRESRSVRPAWSPDGSRLAFFSDDEQDGSNGFGLWVVAPLSGATPKRVAPQVMRPSRGATPWTPDGSHVLAVLDDEAAGYPVCFFPVDGSRPRCLELADLGPNRDPFLVVDDDRWLVIAAADDGSRSPGHGLVVYELDPLR